MISGALVWALANVSAQAQDFAARAAPGVPAPSVPAASTWSLLVAGMLLMLAIAGFMQRSALGSRPPQQ